MRSDTAPYRRKEACCAVLSLFYDCLLLFSFSLHSVFPALLILCLPAIFPPLFKLVKSTSKNTSYNFAQAIKINLFHIQTKPVCLV